MREPKSRNIENKLQKKKRQERELERGIEFACLFVTQTENGANVIVSNRRIGHEDKFENSLQSLEAPCSTQISEQGH